MIRCRRSATVAPVQVGRHAPRLRALLAGTWIATLLAAALPAAADAAWECEFLPDTTSFKASDVVTGRLRLRYLARGRGTVPGPVTMSCYEARYYVTAPDGVTTGMSDIAYQYYRQWWGGCPFLLEDGQDAWLPVCLARWQGRDVFAAAGVYRIVVSVTLVQERTHARTIATAPPVRIRVAAAGTIPAAYRDLLDGQPTICGAARCRFRFTEAELDSLDFGDYTEPALALLNYQFWQLWPSLWLHRPDEHTTHRLDQGQALCRRRLGDRECRGSWFVARIRELEREGAGQGRGPMGYPKLGAGDPVIDCPEGL